MVFGTNLGSYQGTHKCRHMHAHDIYAYTQYSSEYSLFLRYIFPGQFYMCDAVSFASISFALCLKLVCCLIDLFHFKTHKATVMAIVAVPHHASILQPHCRGHCSRLSLKSCLCRTGSRRVKLENKTFFFFGFQENLCVSVCTLLYYVL